MPYYGRAWSTVASAPQRQEHLGDQVRRVGRPSCTARPASSPPTTAASTTRSRASPGPPTGARTAPTTYGCVTRGASSTTTTPQALGPKYDLVNRYGLRGAGIWALGYDGTRPELYAGAQGQVHHRHGPADDHRLVAQRGRPLAQRRRPPGHGHGRGRRVTGLITFGWTVEPFVDGVAGPAVRSGQRRRQGRRVHLGRPDATTARSSPDGAVPDHRLDGRCLGQPRVGRSRSSPSTDGRRSSTVGASPGFISPNGDGRSDRDDARDGAPTSASAGPARMLDTAGATVRRWTLDAGDRRRRGPGTAATRRAGSSPTAATRFRVDGLDPAGNRTVRDLPVRVDRTIRSVTWSRAVVRARGPARRTASSFGLSRPADRHRRDLPGHDARPHGSGPTAPLAAGTYGWTWDGRTATGALVKPGTYRVVVDADQLDRRRPTSRRTVDRQGAVTGRRPTTLAPHDRPTDRRTPPIAPTRRAAGAGVWVVLPTYDEAENIGPISAAILDGAAGGDPARRRRRLARRHRPPGRRAGRRRPADPRPPSRGQAGPRPGLPRRLRRSPSPAAPTTIVQMDADFSHDPAALPALDRADRRRRRRTWSSARATRRAAAVVDWGIGRRIDLARRQPVRPDRARPRARTT